MSFNPARLEPQQKKRYVPLPTDGKRHSDIVRKQGGQSLLPLNGTRDKTLFGFSVPEFKCESFCTRHELMYESTSMGYGYSETGDRTILVRRGALYIMSENKDGERSVHRYGEGNSFHAPKNTKYGLATSGTGSAELFVVETLDYDKSWKTIEQPVLGEAQQYAHEDRSVVGMPTPVRTHSATTLMQAQEMAASQNQRRNTLGSANIRSAPAINPNSANAIGLNLKPSGPPRE